MEDLVKRPNEEIYEIEFSGQFIPDKFNPYWFAKKKLLGEKEAEECQSINIHSGEYCAFRTSFLEIYVETDRFRILSKNIQSYDLVNDMAISISKILKDTFYDNFFISLRLHYSYKTPKELEAVLNNFTQKDSWNNIFEKPQIVGFRIQEIKEHETFKHKRLLSIFPCDRPDMKNTTHLYIRNEFLKEGQEKGLSSVLEENQEHINSDVKFANQILKKYF